MPVTKKPVFRPGRGYTKKDWDSVPEIPELTREDFANARPFAEVFPDLAAAMRRTRGLQKAPTKEQVTLRIDRTALDAFRATGDGWQTRISDTLKRAASRLKKTG